MKAVIGRLKIMFFSSGRITSEETSTSEIRTTESYTHSHRKLTQIYVRNNNKVDAMK